MIRPLLLAKVFGAVSLVLVAGCAAPQQQIEQPRLPALTLPGLRPSDAALDLGGLRGPAVISLWAQWCPPCREEMPVLEAFHVRHPEFTLIGVNWQDPLTKRAIRFAERRGVTYPLVRDPDGALPARYLPRLLFIDAEGRVVHREYVVINDVAQLEKLVHTHLGADALGAGG